MSSEFAEQLSGLLDQLPFAESVMSDNSPDGSKIQVICRVKKGAETQWAKVVEKILRKAQEQGFKAHVCRLYFLKGEAMVYGWHVGLTSKSMGSAVAQVAEAIFGQKRPAVKTPSKKGVSMDHYSPPLQADVKGNPVVAKQVMEMPFTGMEGRADRNIPSPPGSDGRGGGRGVTKISS